MQKIYIKLSLLILTGLTSTSVCMRRDSTSPQEVSSRLSLVELPQDLKNIIIHMLADNNFHKAIKDIRSLASVNKSFYAFINNADTVARIIQLISKNTKNHSVTVAGALGTPAAITWINSYLTQHPNEKLEPVLRNALKEQNYLLAQLLLKHGVKINYTQNNIKKRIRGDNPLTSPLVKAVESGKVALVEDLLKFTTPELILNGALKRALELNNQEIIKLLLGKGAELPEDNQDLDLI